MKMVDDSNEELSGVVEGANPGLGCGNPTAIGKLAQGEIVLDLGSGCGFDCFLATDIGFSDICIRVKSHSRSLVSSWFPGSGAENYVASADIEAFKPL